MKQHIVLKLHKELADSTVIPFWVDFITNKAFVKESVDPEIDRLMRERGLAFWVTKEYRPTGQTPQPEEFREGLNRTYRMILQQDYSLPPGLVERIKLIPSVEDAHALEIAAAPLPPPLAETASLDRQKPSDVIGLRYARVLTRGSRDVRIAVLDTGVDLGHPELQGKIVKRADFVNLEGLDTSSFVGDHLDADDIPEDEVGHGTHVSGIIAGKGRQMDEGVAPDCGIMAVRVLATLKQDNRYVRTGGHEMLRLTSTALPSAPTSIPNRMDPL